MKELDKNSGEGECMSISSIVNKQKEYFYKGHTRSVETRKNNLKKLYDGIQRFEDRDFSSVEIRFE